MAKDPIWSYLEAKGISQRWLARETGVADAELSRYKRGLRPPTPRFRAAASKALGMSEDMLFKHASKTPEEVA